MKSSGEPGTREYSRWEAWKKSLLRGKETLWQAAAGGMMILVAGTIGYLAGNPWLFPSLGSTAFLLAVYPDTRLARFADTLIGHLAGAASGYLVVIALGLAGTPSVFEAGRLYPARVLASGLGVALVIMLQMALKVRHPPGAATALLIALGGFKPVWQDSLAIAAGAAILATLGELSRRLRQARPEKGR